jgi:hypothetical protein
LHCYSCHPRSGERAQLDAHSHPCSILHLNPISSITLSGHIHRTAAADVAEVCRTVDSKLHPYRHHWAVERDGRGDWGRCDLFSTSLASWPPRCFTASTSILPLILGLQQPSPSSLSLTKWTCRGTAYSYCQDAICATVYFFSPK